MKLRQKNMLDVAKSHEKLNRSAINGPIKHPKAPPRPMRALYVPALPSGMSSIDKETVDMWKKP